MNAAVIVAAGRGERMGAGMNKALLPLAGEALVLRSARALFESGCFRQLVVVTGEADLPAMRALFEGKDIPVTLVPGGADRQQSVLCGLRAIGPGCDIVAIHDGARPLVTGEIIQNALASAQARGSGVAAVPMKDTVKRVTADGLVLETPERASLAAVQTPQAFRYPEILAAHLRHADDPQRATDDAALMERDGMPVYLTAGSPENLKITTPEDMETAAAILKRRGGAAPGEENAMEICVGHGYDVHRLTEGRKLILCGVDVPYERGLLGHSDADVALHALMDALLGAAGLGDIGRHYPDTDPAYAGADSGALLDRVMGMLREAGFGAVNADITIICQRPKLAPYIEEMRRNVARHLGLDASRVNVKATTTERLGFEGEGLGISCHAVCLIGRG